MSTTDSNSTNWVGFHGTSFSAACQILADKFRTSTGEAEWLGHGVYFFIEGLNDPMEKASAWARKRAWVRNRKKYVEFAVLESVIITSAHLDLDDEEDQRMFETIRERCDQQMRDYGLNEHSKAIDNDCFLANFAMDNLGLDAMVRKEAILTERFQLKTRYPNCRIMCVRDPVKCVLENRIAAKGRV